MDKNIILLLLTFLLVFTFACSQKEVDPIQDKIKKTIAELRGDVPETIIDISTASEVTLSPSFTISDEHLVESGMFFVDISSVYYADGIYYVVDAGQNTIFTFNKNWEHIGNIGQYGRGPVDFDKPSGIFKHKNRYFIADNGNLRVQILDEDYNVLTAIQDINFITFYPHVSSSDTYLGILNYNPASDYSLMLFVHDNYEKVHQLLMPRILEPFEMPLSLNLIHFNMNSQGNIAIAYTALPHIFLYNSDIEITNFITLRGIGALDNNGNYLIYSEASTDIQPMTRSRILSLLIDESKNMYLVNRAENIVYLINYDSGYYKNSIKLKLEELSQSPLIQAFIVGNFLTIVDKKNANQINFYDLYQP